MRTIRALITAAVALTAIAAYGQKPLEDIGQAYDRLVASLYTGGNIVSQTKENYPGWSRTEVRFAFPAKKSKLISDYNSTLFGWSAKAYSSFVKRAGANDNSQMNIAWGEDNRQETNFGSWPNRNYNIQFIRDRRDSTMRYAYALVWYVRNDSLLGSVDRYYGKDPRLSSRHTMVYGFNSKGRKGTWIIDKDNGSIYGPGISIDDKGVFINGTRLSDYANRGGEWTVDATGNVYGPGISIDDKGIYIDGKKYSDYPLPTLQSEMKRLQNELDNIQLKKKIKNSTDFVNQFNNLHIFYSSLCSSYKDYKKCNGDEQTGQLMIMNLMVAVLNKANDMCSNYYNVINTPAKKFIASQLDAMADESKDQYIGDAFKAMAKELLSKAD